LVAFEWFKRWAGTSHVDPSQLCSQKKQGEGPPKTLEFLLFYVKSRIPLLVSEQQLCVAESTPSLESGSLNLNFGSPPELNLSEE
jgi:hypothetical protein